jgi:YhcH/YjgK/YiaL family protein
LRAAAYKNTSMILDQITNASLYQFKNPRLARGLEFLQSENVAILPPGRIDLEGDHLFALVQEYPTRIESECFWEAHRKYIDIQYLITGKERIDYAPLSLLEITKPYDLTKDRLELFGNGSRLQLSVGMFAIFFPHDAHRPCMATPIPAPVKKIVVKVAVSQ